MSGKSIRRAMKPKRVEILQPDIRITVTGLNTYLQVSTSRDVNFSYNGTMKASSFTSLDVQKIAALARIPISDEQAQDLADGFTKTMGVIDELNNIQVNETQATSQVTGLENVMREDEIDTSRMFTQEEALSNAKRTHNGYFVVDQVLED